VWLLKLALILMTTLCVSPAVAQQDQSPTAEANHEFFSGTVVDYAPDKITVARTILGKAPETRSFTITSETKMEGKPRVKGRVTVGFKVDEGDVAVRIIVRNTTPNQKPKK
jgi:hypothetical protein